MLTLDMYKEDDGRWFFDDATNGIAHEEMVLGADTLLDRAANGARRLTIEVSTEPLDNPTAALEFVRPGGPEDGDIGSWYRDAVTGLEAWLCPTLLVYFDPSPPRLWVRTA